MSVHTCRLLLHRGCCWWCSNLVVASFRGGNCFLGSFISQFYIIQYTNYIWNTISPVFIHVAPCTCRLLLMRACACVRAWPNYPKKKTHESWSHRAHRTMISARIDALPWKYVAVFDSQVEVPNRLWGDRVNLSCPAMIDGQIAVAIIIVYCTIDYANITQKYKFIYKDFEFDFSHISVKKGSYYRLNIQRLLFLSL